MRSKKVSYNGVENNQIGSKVSYQGKETTVVNTSAAYITVIDDQGNRISLPKKSPLFDFSHIIDSNNKLIANINDEVEKLEVQKDVARADEKNFLAQMSSKCKEWGVNFWHQMDSSQKATYKELKDKYYDAKFSSVAASNRMHSALMSKLDLTLDNAKYNYLS